MIVTALSPSDLDRLRVVVRERWPSCAEAQGCRRARVEVVIDLPPRIEDGVCLFSLPGIENHETTLRALESLARILEDAGYAIERRDTARIVTGWVVIGGRRIADLDPWDPVREMYDTGLSLGRAQRDKARLEGIGANGPYEHAVQVNEMARRSVV